MRYLITFFLIALATSAKPQKLEYKVLFEGIGDNREFFNDLGYPQTILGTRSAFELGTSFDNHSVRFGLSWLYEFGSQINDQIPVPIIYYQFKKNNNEFLLGSFPRKDKIDFPLAMLTDTLLYYRPTIECLYGKTGWKWGWQNAFIDWVSRTTEEKREIFTTGSSGEIFKNHLFLQNYILLTHQAKTTSDNQDEQISDFMGFALQAGVRTVENKSFSGYFKGGVLNSQYRNRAENMKFKSATSFFAEACGKYKWFGLKAVLSAGAGHNFAYGDHFYRAHNYFRTDAICYFLNRENIKGRFNYSFHFIDWKDINQQQQLSIIYIFGN